MRSCSCSPGARATAPGSGIDDDCNGAIDEEGCALAWLAGDTEDQYLGTWLYADTEDRSLWAWGSQKAGTVAGKLGTGVLQDGELVPTWEASERVHDGGTTLASLGDIPALAYATWNDDEGAAVLVQPPVPGETTEAVTLARWVLPASEVENYAVMDVDLWSDGAASLLMVGTMANVAALIESPEDRSSDNLLADARAVYTTDPEVVNFGYGAGLLEDGAGDGATLALVSAFDEEASGAWIWAFDTEEAGSLETDVAVATIELKGSYGGRPRAAGDLDGDGYPDLLADAWNSRMLLYGPFAGDISYSRVLGAYATTIEAVGDLDGDGHDDLIATETSWPEPATCVFHGPLSRAAEYGAADGDACLATPLELRASVIADADGDGEPEIVGANGYYYGGTISRQGLIAFFPVP